MWRAPSPTGYLNEWSTRERKRKKPLTLQRKIKEREFSKFKKLSYNINLTFKIIYIIII